MLKNKWVMLEENKGDDGAGAAAGAAGNDSAASAAAADQSAANAVADKDGAQAGAAAVAKPEVKPEVKPIWPEDWRKHLAGDDEKEAKRVGRFATPTDVYKAYRALEARLSSGELKSALPKDAKPEEVAQWRKENGIPEAPDKYEVKLANDVVIGEEDKPMVAEFLKSAHAKNMTAEQANASLQFYYDNQVRLAEARAAKDETDRQAVLDTLNAEWGGEFRNNVNLTRGVLSRFPQAVQDGLANARLPDGTALFNNPDVMRGFVAMALEINPAGTLVPNGNGDPVKGVNDRLAEIEKVMSTNRKAYNKDEKMQAEYRDLLVAREKINARK